MSEWFYKEGEVAFHRWVLSKGNFLPIAINKSKLSRTTTANMVVHDGLAVLLRVVEFLLSNTWLDFAWASQYVHRKD